MMINIDDVHAIRINDAGKPDICGSGIALIFIQCGDEGDTPQSLIFKLSEDQTSELVRDIFSLDLLPGYWA